MRLDHFELLFHALQLLAQGLAGGEQGAGILAPALRHSHGLGIGVALGAQPIRFYLHGLALLLQRGNARDVQHESAPRQRGGNSGQIAAQQLRIKHCEFLGPGTRPLL